MMFLKFSVSFPWCCSSTGVVPHSTSFFNPISPLSKVLPFASIYIGSNFNWMELIQIPKLNANTLNLSWIPIW
jgi:hypothetical protein